MTMRALFVALAVLGVGCGGSTLAKEIETCRSKGGLCSGIPDAAIPRVVFQVPSCCGTEPHCEGGLSWSEDADAGETPVALEGGRCGAI